MLIYDKDIGIAEAVELYKDINTYIDIDTDVDLFVSRNFVVATCIVNVFPKI